MPWIERRIAGDGRTRYAALYRDPTGRKRSAGTYSSKALASKAAHAAGGTVDRGAWIDPRGGRENFAQFVERAWWPSRHLEISTRAAYRSNLDQHLIPYFGHFQLSSIRPSTVQSWVTQAVERGLSPRSVRKYHTLLHGIFARAILDQAITSNPAAHTELPKVIGKKMRVLTPTEFERLVAAIPEQHRLMVIVAAETGVRWGELVALRPRHIDVNAGVLTVEDVYVEVSRKNSPTGERMILRHYPKDNEPRSMRIAEAVVTAITRHIARRELTSDDLLWSTRVGTPISRNTFRTRIWLPAIAEANFDFHVRWHDLRHTHASWLLAGGADLKTVMDRLGHSQLATTQRYIHAMPRADDAALAALARIRPNR